jgi:hypothetical protein
MRTGQSRYSEGQTLSVPAIRKDGTQISVEFTIVPFTDHSGQMIGIAAIMRDTTAPFEELRDLHRQLADLAPKPESNTPPGPNQPSKPMPSQPRTIRLYSVFLYFIPEASAHSATIRFRIELASPPMRRVRNRSITAAASFEG